MNTTQKYIAGGVALIAIIAGTALASSYITRTSLAPEEKPVAAIAPAPATAKPAPQARAVHHRPRTQQQQMAQQQQLPPCEDHNIVGTAAGAVAGGLVGNQFGKGSGRTVATLGGVAGGAYLGNEYIPTRGAACR